MSSTWVAEFDNKKDYKHFCKRYKKIAPNGENIIVPDLPENPDKVRLRGAYVDLEQDIYILPEGSDPETDDEIIKKGAWAISFDIDIWDDWTKEFIQCIFNEMCQRYSFVEIGCNSIKLLSQEEFLKQLVFGHSKRTMEYYRKVKCTELCYIWGWGKEVRVEQFDKLKKEIERVEKVFKEAAKRFFDGDASDLILINEKKR